MAANHSELNEPVIEIQRITTRFDQFEDRIVIHAETTGPENVSLWMTQRLLLRLIPHLLDRLDHLISPQHKSGTANKRTDTLMQTFAQQSACQTLDWQAPVQESAPDRHYLVSSVDITATEQQTRLIFKSLCPDTLKLVMLAAELRQWLMICHSLWGKAQWPMHIWPVWITEQDVDTSRSKVSLH
ncbi:MAG: hypothetical protein RQ757_04980 [Pseudomonadales bacterium]|nr:hypothetical protein [Pseudomonadales bacterium]